MYFCNTFKLQQSQTIIAYWLMLSKLTKISQWQYDIKTYDNYLIGRLEIKDLICFFACNILCALVTVRGALFHNFPPT